MDPMAPCDIQNARPAPTHLFRPQHAQTRTASITGKGLGFSIAWTKFNAYSVLTLYSRNLTLGEIEFKYLGCPNTVLTCCRLGMTSTRARRGMVYIGVVSFPWSAFSGWVYGEGINHTYSRGPLRLLKMEGTSPKDTLSSCSSILRTRRAEFQDEE